MKRFWAAAAVGAAISAPALAHPHAWIDLESTVVFDFEGRISGIRQRWIFDEGYTAFALEGVPRGADDAPAQADLDALLNENLKNLSEYSYFNESEWAGRRVPFAGVSHMSSAFRDQRIDMTFTVTFTEPVRVAEGPLTYGIFDPTYFAEMLHLADAAAVKLENAPDGCRAELKKPQPAADMIAFAASLDQTESGGDTLGSHFAERVTVTCR